MSFFQDLGVFVHNNPKSVAQRSYAHALTVIQRCLRGTPLGLCIERVIVNEKPLNLEKTSRCCKVTY